LSIVEGSRGATVLIGLSGLVVGAQQEIDGELWLLIETTADFMGSLSCGTQATGHGRQRVSVRDLPVAGRPTMLCVAKRRWRCTEPDCEVNTWTERLEGISARAVLTDRARRQIAEIGTRDARDKYRNGSYISDGPVAQFNPITSTRSASTAARAAPISVPPNILPVNSRVTCA